MKKLILLLSISVSLFAAAPFTLDNIEKLRVYCIIKTDYFDKKQELLIKELAEKKLKKVGINLNKVDSSTLMIKIESIKLDKMYVVNTSIAIGEEIVTKRKDRIETLAFTYYANDLIDTDEPYTDTMESINFLLDSFSEAYLEDKE